MLLTLTLQLAILTEKASATAPSIVTLEATNINSTSATLNGYLTNNFSKDSDVWFEYGTSPSFGNSTSLTTPVWMSNYSVEGDGVTLGTENGLVDDDWSTYGGTYAENSPDVNFIYINATYNLSNFSPNSYITVKDNMKRQTSGLSFARIWCYYYNWDEETRTLAYTRYANSWDDSITNTTSSLPANATNNNKQIQMTFVLRVESKINNKDAYVYLYSGQVLQSWEDVSPNTHFRYVLNGISPSTTKYYYRAVASNEDGITYGTTYTFGGENFSSYPLNPTSITTTSASLRGYLNYTEDTTTKCGFWVSNQTNDFDSLQYNYYAYNENSSLWENPNNIIEESTSSYSYIPKDTTRNQTLTLNNCSNLTGYDIGTIRRVEVRFYRYTDIPVAIGEKWGGNINITPIFAGTEGGTYSIIPSSTPKWSNWTDITNDANAPVWTWDAIQTLDLNISGFVSSVDADTGIFVSKVEIRVSGNASTFTSSGTYNTGETFSASASGLTSTEYYYVRTWMNADYGFNVSSNETYFITRPTAPSNFENSSASASRIVLSWTNATFLSGVNHSVLIHYSTTAPVGTPVAAQWGTFGANISNASTAEIMGLSEDVTYYFVAWTYINNSGSPSRAIFSTAFTTTSGETEGGNYTIQVRYENESTHGNLPVSLTQWGYHRLFIHYTNKTDEFKVWNDGTGPSIQQIGNYYYTGDDSDLANGTIVFESNQTIKWIEFHWNESNGSIFRCNRIILPLASERNFTFYIRTDLPVYGETLSYESHTDYASVTNPDGNATITATYNINTIISVYVYNASIYGSWISVPNDKYNVSGNQVIVNNSVLDHNSSMVRVDYYIATVVAGTSSIEGTLVSYTYTFKDPSTLFTNAPELDAYVDIYCFNSIGERLTIHREYFSSNDEVHPMLVFDKKYFIGVGSTIDTVDRIGIAPTEEDTTPEPIYIPQTSSIQYSFFDIVNTDFGWEDADTGLWVDFQDTSFDTTSATLRVYYENGTEAYNETTTLSSYNFSFLAANQSYDYDIWLEVNNTEIWNTNISINFTMYAGMTPVYDSTSLDDLLDTILGNTPMRQFDNEGNPTGVAVSWTYIFVGLVAFILILSFGHINAYLGMLSTGMWLIASETLISGLPFVFVAVGGFLIAMAIIFGMGSKVS